MIKHIQNNLLFASMHLSTLQFTGLSLATSNSTAFHVPKIKLKTKIVTNLLKHVILIVQGIATVGYCDVHHTRRVILKENILLTKIMTCLFPSSYIPVQGQKRESVTSWGWHHWM
jgi:hypothetical protein